MNKKFFPLFAALFIVLCVSYAWAQGTFLVCDPAQVKQENGAKITHYELKVKREGEEPVIERYEPEQVNATHVRINHEITDMDAGKYTFKARWVDERYNHTSDWTNSVTDVVPDESDMPACEGFRKE